MLTEAFGTLLPLAPAIAGFLGQREANQTNVDIANRTSAFNAEEAERNRNWQRQMSNTAHTREIRDLQAAGLNPLLSATGGASTPGGSAASGVAATVKNTMEGAMSSAMEMKQLMLAAERQKAEIGLMKAQTSKAATEAEVVRKGIPEAEMKNDIYDVMKPYLQKLKQSAETGARLNPKQQRINDYMRDFDKRQQQKRMP